MSDAPPQKPHYGPPEKRHPVVTLLLWLAIILGIGGIGWMVWKAPPEKPLVCDPRAVHSLWSFGTCTEK